MDKLFTIFATTHSLHRLRTLLPVALLTLTAMSCKKKPQEEPAPTKAATTETAVTSSDQDYEYTGTPEIPASLVEYVVSYYDHGRGHIIALSQSGAELTVLFGNKLARLDSPTSAPELVHDADLQVTGATPLGDMLVYMEADGTEFQEIILYDSKSDTKRSLAGLKNPTGFLVQAGQLIVSDQVANDRVEVHRFAGPTFETSTVVVKAEGVVAPACLSPDGKTLLLLTLASSSHSYLEVIELATGNRRWLEKSKEKSQILDCSFKDANTLYVLSDRGREHVAIFRVDLATNQWTALNSDLLWDVEAYVVTDNGTIAFTANENGVSRLYLQLQTGARVTLGDQAGPRRQITEFIDDGVIGDLTSSGDVIAFYHRPADGPQRLYSYNIEEGGLTRWGADWKRTIKQVGLVAPSVISFSSFDGHEVSALYYRPSGDGPFPVLVDFHGGPASQTRVEYSAFYQPVIDRGIAVVAPNVRGSTGYGKSFEGLDDRLSRHNVIKDVGALLSWIAGVDELDGKRVCMHGTSYGGYLALASLAEFGDAIACGISNAGVSSLVTFLENDKRLGDERRREFGDERDPDQRAYLQRISPLTNVEHIVSPLLLTHGYLDPRVSIDEAKQIESALRAKGRKVWSLYAKHMGHGIRSAQQVAVILLFLDKHLLGSPRLTEPSAD